MSNRAILFVAPLLGLLCSATGSQAGMITWTADWSQSSNAVAANGGPMTGGVTFATAPTGAVETGSQTYTAATLTTFTSAQTGSVLGPDLFTSAPYTLKVNLTDLTSNLSNMLTFTGSLTGSLTTTTASFTNTFNTPLSQTALIGANEYTVTLTSFLAPGAPNPVGGGSPFQGYFQAQVNVQSLSVITPVTSPAPVTTPEPSSLILAGLGTSLVGLLRWRRPKVMPKAG